MNAVLDNLIVAAVLLASVGYAVVKLGPRTLRKRILSALRLVLESAPAFLKLGSVAQRLAAASGKTQAACGGCDNCGTESTSVAKPPSEVSVPVAKISRRT
jgi:hypothetical protein